MPVAVDVARRIRSVAPDAWVVNFTNPAGLVTEATTRELGDRVIGICDSPAGLGRRVLGALDVDPARARLDYAGRPTWPSTGTGRPRRAATRTSRSP